ncbi:MAG TPA: glycosyltransferase 87 family protein [Chloroflexota bacterium]
MLLAFLRERPTRALAPTGLGLALLYLSLWPLLVLVSERAHYTHVVLGRVPMVGLVLQALQVPTPPPGERLAWYTEAAVGFLLVVTLAAVLYLFAIVATGAWRGPRQQAMVPRLAVGYALLFQLILASAPGTLTTDLYSYAFYGQAVAMGRNPYTAVPADFPDDPLLNLIDPMWRQTPAIYGPVWLLLSAGIALASPLDIGGQVLLYRLLANGVHLVTLLLLWHLLHRWGVKRPLQAWTLYAWNPLVLIEASLNNHNDVVMVALMVGALLAVTYGRWGNAVLALALASLVKFTAGLLLPLLLLRQHRRRAIRLGLAAAALMVAAFLPWWNGNGPLFPFRQWIEHPFVWHYAPTPVALALSATLQWSGYPGIEADQIAYDVVVGVARLAFLAFAVSVVLRGRRLSLPQAGIQLFVAYLLLAQPWVMPWYFLWVLPLASIAGWDDASARFAVALSLSAAVGMYVDHFAADWRLPAYIISLAPALVLLASRSLRGPGSPGHAPLRQNVVPR